MKPALPPPPRPTPAAPRQFVAGGLGLRALGVLCGSIALAGFLSAAERPLGDLDNDGVHTAVDLARQIALARGQPAANETDAVYADTNRDGVINDADSAAIVRLILETDTPEALPPATVRETSPGAGASGVALTREFVVYFTMPLALDAVVTTHNPNTNAHGNLYAEFGGARLLTRAELSSDRRKATLFFLEPLPASARVRVTFDPAGLNDLLERDLAPGVRTFDFDTISITALANTGVVGRVFGVSIGTTPATPTPLAGVTITVDGAEQTLRTTTAADGSFALTPAPAGRFFVLIDGRTATNAPANGYYAYVGKAWAGVPGRLATPATPASATTAAGDIHLPFIPTGTLQATSAVQDTTITFPDDVVAANPALAGVQLTVPANSLFANDGTRGGLAGIAPIAPDKLPEPLPVGIEHTLDITIQTDGATNFDRPVPVRFPNLPAPGSTTPPAPGTKMSLVSFNHDTGRWEVVGPATVSADGRFIATDAGVGVRQPGWHGMTPEGGDGGGGDMWDPPDDDDDGDDDDDPPEPPSDE